jgi:hypothetical protein
VSVSGQLVLICIGFLNRLLIVWGIMDGSAVSGQNVYPGARPTEGGRALGERERLGKGQLELTCRRQGDIV